MQENGSYHLGLGAQDYGIGKEKWELPYEPESKLLQGGYIRDCIWEFFNGLLRGIVGV